MTKSSSSSLLSHPLSPDLHSHSTPPLFPEPPPSPVPSSSSTAASPLFPASPPNHEPSDESIILASRRASGVTLAAATTPSDNLQLPTSASSVSLARSFSGQSTTSTTNNNAAQDTDDEPPLPRYLILPSAPHLLSSSTLAALPLSHLTALVAALSKENEEATLELARKEKEVQVLVGLAREGVKAGEGEIERARVRARVGVGDVASAVEEGQRRKDWRIELLAKEQSPALEQGKEEIEDHTGGVSEIVLNLDDLAEAISENAFDFAPSPTTPKSTSQADATLSDDGLLDDGASISRASISSSRSMPSSTANGDLSSATIPLPPTGKPGRQRHASLSSRIFGSFSISPSPPPLSTSPTIPHSPASTSGLNHVAGSSSPAAAGKSSRRQARSNSVASTASGSSSLASNERNEGSGYGEWIGWKGWGRGGAKEQPSQREEGRRSALGQNLVQGDEGETGSIVEESEEEGDEEQTVGVDGEDEGEGEMTTPMPNSSLGFFGGGMTATEQSPTSPSRRPRLRGRDSDTSSTTPSLHRLNHSPPPDSLLSVNSHAPTTTTSTSNSDDTTSTPDTEEHTQLSPPKSPSAREGKRLAPHSPTLSRPRGVSAPLMNASNATASPSLGLTTPVPISTLSQPSNDVSSPEQEAAGDEEDEDEDRDGDRTIKARRRLSGSKKLPPFLSVATPLHASSTNTIPTSKSHKDLSYASTAKDAVGRALGLGASTTSSPASPGMKRSHSDGVRRASGGVEPNLTLFPKLSSLSKYSPFAQPALSTPSTQVSLSSHSTSTYPASATAAGNATPTSLSSPMSSTNAPTTTTSTTMELSTISGEAAPPTLASMGGGASSSLGRSLAGGGGGEDGPLVDRYGFVHDVRSGMKLLREARRRKERLARGEASTVAGEGEGEEALRAAAAALLESSSTAAEGVSREELALEDELEAMRVAMNLPLGGAGTSPAHSRSPGPRSPSAVPSLVAVGGSSGSGNSPLAPAATPSSSRPARLVRSPSSSDSSNSKKKPPGPQSMKLLLTTLKDMSDALEHAQKIAWDAFIRRRQAVLRSHAHVDGGSEDKVEVKGKGKRSSKRSPGGNRNRPKTVFATSGGELGEAFAARSREGSCEDLVGVESERGWSEDLVGVSQMGVAGKSGKEDWAEFKELVRKGVPIAYRPKIWAECSGANEAREPGLYQELLAQHKSEENQCLNQIDMDCHRTFPTNVFFAGNGPGVAKLRNVLIAYSWRNPKIGYCQGMNNLTATLLLTHPAEEDAFWVLVCIIEKILPEDYYTSHLLVSQADQRVLRDLIQRLLPTVAAHLEDLGVELPAITFGWFLSLFTDALPIQTLLRIWDLIFVLGTVMLFRVAVAIIQINQAEILACDSAASLYALMRAMTTHLYQVDKLLKIACEDLRPLIKDRDISVLRNKHVADLQVELGILPEEGGGAGEGVERGGTEATP